MRNVSRHEKTLRAVFDGAQHANIQSFELRGLLLHLGFDESIRGSHHVFSMHGVGQLLNLQRSGSKAEPYQVRQVRAI